VTAISMIRPSILVVEDEYLIARDITEFLISSGYESVRSVSSGEGALEEVARLQPDVVLMDIILEGELDGVETARRIRQQYDIPVIFLTAHSDGETIRRAKDIEPLGYLLKPINHFELYTTIEVVLHKNNAERRLRASEEKYRELVEDVNSIIIKTDMDGNIVFMNGFAETFFGYRLGEVGGKPLAAMMIPGEERRTNLVTRILMEPEKYRSCEFETVRRDGRRAWIAWTNRVLHDDNGEMAGILSVGNDLTYRRRAEEIARRYQLLFDNSRDIILFMRHPDGSILEANNAAALAYGYRREELLGMNIRVLRAQGSLENLDAQMERAFRDGILFETVHRRCDGSEFPVEESSRGATLATDNVIFSIIRDITQRRHLEDERERLIGSLDKRIKELRCFYRISEVIERPGATMESILKEMLPIIGDAFQFPDITAVRIRYRDLEYVTHTFCETQWKIGAPLSVYGEKAGEVEVFYRQEKPDASSGPFLEEEVRLLDAVSARLGLIIEKILAEEELRKSREELRDLARHLQSLREEERKQISREIHDELGQALTAMKMDIYWLKKVRPDESEKLNQKVESLLRLIDSTIEKVRKISSHLRPGILDDLGLHSAIEWLAGEHQERTGIRIDFSFDIGDEDAGNALVTTIFRIVQEALTNIARHSRATRASIGITEKSGCIEIRISDNGIGISEEQVRDPRSFGLIGIRERAAVHGGEVEISGTANGGTMLAIWIPRDGGVIRGALNE
jgi:PAS domain S-box-containing protein